jgi:hypothetical protein
MPHSEMDPTPRRTFLGRLAAAGVALGLGASTARSSAAAERLSSGNAPEDHWLDNLKGKHKQLVDAYAANEGLPLAFAWTFLTTQAAGSTAGAVVVLRHGAFPLALTSPIWEKYKIGEKIKLDDPATKSPASKNPFYQAAPGTLLTDDMAIDKLMARGAVFGCCNVALHLQSAAFAENAGVSKEEALKEWTAGIIPGITIIPSGTWGVNRAQEHGCTYCAGGGA